MADHRGGHVHGRGDAGSCQGILQVVRAGDVDFLHLADGPLRPLPAHHEHIPVHIGAAGHLLLAGEEHDLALHLLHQGGQGGIVRVEYRHVLACLVAEHAHLHGGVILHGAMAVQVILGNVQQRGGLGMEGVRRLHLEGADLADEHVVPAAVQRSRAVGIADIAHHVGHMARVAEDFPQQGHRGGLAVGTGDGHHLPLGQLVRQLQLAGHINVLLLRLEDEGGRVRDAGADDQRVDARQALPCGPAQLPFHRKRRKRSHGVAQLLPALGIIHNHLRAVLQQQLRSRHAAAGHAHHQHALVLIIHHLSHSFRVIQMAGLTPASGQSRTAPPPPTGQPCTPRSPGRSASPCSRTARSGDGWASS